MLENVKSGNDTIFKNEQSKVSQDEKSASSFNTACDEVVCTNVNIATRQIKRSNPEQEQNFHSASDDVWQAGPGSILHELCGRSDITIAELRQALEENP